MRLVGPKPEWVRPDGGEGGTHPSNVHDHIYALGAINFTGGSALCARLPACWFRLLTAHACHAVCRSGRPPPNHPLNRLPTARQPSGDHPVVLTVDGPSLGGFVCPATITTAQLWKIGQVGTNEGGRTKAGIRCSLGLEGRARAQRLRVLDACCRVRGRDGLLSRGASRPSAHGPAIVNVQVRPDDEVLFEKHSLERAAAERAGLTATLAAVQATANGVLPPAELPKAAAEATAAAAAAAAAPDVPYPPPAPLALELPPTEGFPGAQYRVAGDRYVQVRAG